MTVISVHLQVRQLDKYIRWTDLAAPEDCDMSDGYQTKMILDSESGPGGAHSYLLRIVVGTEESQQGPKRKDVKYTARAQDDAAVSEDGSQSQTTASDCIDRWMPERDVPLQLIKDFEARAQAQRRTKLSKPARRVQAKSGKTLKRGAFWARICAPLPPEEPNEKKTVMPTKHGRKKATVLVSRHQLLVPER